MSNGAEFVGYLGTLNFESMRSDAPRRVQNQAQCSCGETFLKDSGNQSLCPTCRNPKKRIQRATKMLSNRLN